MTKRGSVTCIAGPGLQPRKVVMTTRRCFVAGMVAAGGGLKAGSAAAQEFPARPVTLIVAVPAGTSADASLRALARAAEKHLRQPIVIENRPGVSATLGPAQMAASAKPDGYTVAQVSPSVFRLPFLGKTTYDPAKDFAYIIAVTAYTIGVVVRSDAPWKTFQELLADAKANPGKITYGTGGIATIGYIAMERIAKQQGIKWVHVPFKGGDDVNAVLGGHVHAIADPAAWASQVNAGRLRLLVTVGSARTRSWPAVPTLKEIGFDIVMDSPYGIAGPGGMEPKIVKVLHDAFRNAMEDPSFKATIAQFDQEPYYLSSADYHDFALRQIAEEKRIAEELGLKY
jgi:tripartite-type tricarboxylate transporter receptor subunit TctC